MDPALFPHVESIQVTVIEEHPDGRRVVHVFDSIESIPEHLRPSFSETAAEPAAVVLSN